MAGGLAFLTSFCSGAQPMLNVVLVEPEIPTANTGKHWPCPWLVELICISRWARWVFSLDNKASNEQEWPTGRAPNVSVYDNWDQFLERRTVWPNV